MRATWLEFVAAAILLSTAAARAAEPNWPDHLKIGTASPGGTYYVYGEGLAKLLTRTLDLPVIRLAGGHEPSSLARCVAWALA
jgi:TRAP-type uncharacterized transport system substrate-binding protein